MSQTTFCPWTKHVELGETVCRQGASLSLAAAYLSDVLFLHRWINGLLENVTDLDGV